MTAVVVNIPGQPVPKGRPRFTRGGFAYTPEKTRKYEKLVAGLAKTAMAGRPPFGCPVKVMVTAFMKMPQMSKKRTADALAGYVLPAVKPDADNLAKAALDANMKFGDEVVYVENDGMKTAVVIGDTVRQGNYEYKYTDNTGIQRKLAKNQELIQLLGNVWNDQAVPLNKVEIVKDILANAEFENVDKYFLEQNTAMTPQLAGNVQPLPAAGLETREVTNGQANGIDTLA